MLRPSLPPLSWTTTRVRWSGGTSVVRARRASSAAAGPSAGGGAEGAGAGAGGAQAARPPARAPAPLVCRNARRDCFAMLIASFASGRGCRRSRSSRLVLGRDEGQVESAAQPGIQRELGLLHVRRWLDI